LDSRGPQCGTQLGRSRPFLLIKKKKGGGKRKQKKKATNVKGKQKAKAKAKATSKGKDKTIGAAKPKAKAKTKTKPKEPDPGAEVDQAVQDFHDVFVNFAAYTEHCNSSTVCSGVVYIHGYNITVD
jgi:hypothetical protein